MVPLQSYIGVKTPLRQQPIALVETLTQQPHGTETVQYNYSSVPSGSQRTALVRKYLVRLENCAQFKSARERLLMATHGAGGGGCSDRLTVYIYVAQVEGPDSDNAIHRICPTCATTKATI